jgi:CRISPR-associated protein Cas2
MRVLLVYDIVDDKQRLKIANACQDYGLDRVQYSAFSGLLNRNRQEELMMKIEALLGDGDGRIHLYPIDEKAWKRRLFIERGMVALKEDEYDIPASADE